MRRLLAALCSTLCVLPFALLAQQDSLSSVPDSPTGFDQQYSALFRAFEKGNEQEMNTRIAAFAIPAHWFNDVFGSEQGPVLAKQYDEVFHDFTSATIGEFRSAGLFYKNEPGQISTKPWKGPVNLKAQSILVPAALISLPPAKQFQIRYQSPPTRDLPATREPPAITPLPEPAIAPGRDDTWVSSFVYVDGAFRFFGGGVYPFWHPCSKSGPLPGGTLIKRVLPVYPSNVPFWEVQKFFVQVGLTIDKDGSVKKIEILQGDSRLVDAARRALQQWRYEPFENCGEPIEKRLTVVVGFAPH